MLLGICRLKYLHPHKLKPIGQRASIETHGILGLLHCQNDSLTRQVSYLNDLVPRTDNGYPDDLFLLCGK